MNIIEKYTDNKTKFLNIKKIKVTDLLLELDYISFQILNLLDSIFKYKDYPNFHNILGEFEKIKANFETVNAVVAQIKTIDHKNKDLFPIIEDKSRKIADYIDAKLYYNADFLEILLGIKKYKLYDSEEELDILNDYIENIKYNGVFLSKKLKNRLTILYNQRDILQEKYDSNLLNFETNAYYLITNEKLLDGIPSYVKKEFEKQAKQKRKKGFLIKNNYSNYSTIVDSALNPVMRKKATIEFNKTGNNNKKIILKLLKIRQELANILGDKNYAQNVFNSGHTSISLPKLKTILKSVIFKSRKKAHQDLLLLKDISSKFKINMIESYDIDFLLDKKNEERENQKDSSKRILLLKDYYKLPTVFDGIKSFLKHSFGLSFIKTEFKSFHSKILVYKVVQNRKLLGYIHFDIFSRKNKTNDAYALNLISRTNKNIGHVLVSCGFKNNNVEFEDVSTLYHELGHSIHFLLSKSEYHVKNSINIKQDFSELPSLLFEKFLKNDDFLKQWLRHYKTNKKLPKRIKSLYPNSKLEFEGFNVHKGAYLALLDIMIHELPINKKTDIKAFEYEFNQKYGIMPHTKEVTYNLYNFSHIFGNQPYDCLYYSYIYSNMLETQIYSKFKKAKYKNWNKVGKEFSKNFLEKGSKGKAFEHYIKFAKKMPDSTFLLKQYKII